MENKRARILIKSIIGMIIMCVLIYLAVCILGTDRSPYRVIGQAQISGKITKASGQVIKDLKPDEWRLSRGDTLTAKIKLPKKNPYEDSCLCFIVYNASVNVTSGGQTLYEYGQDIAASGRQIGNLYVTVNIPQSTWGKRLTIDLVQQERTHTLQNTTFSIVPATRAQTFPIVGRGLEFVIFFVLMFIGCGIGLSGLIFASDRKNRVIMTSLGMSTFLLCCWYFGYNRFFYVISSNIRLNAMAEYYSLDLVSLPIIVFVYAIVEDALRKKIVYWVGVCVGAYCIGSLGLSGFRLILLSDALPGLQIILAVQFGILLWLLISSIRRERSAFAASVLLGITIGMAFAVLEVVAIRARNLDGFPHFLLGITKFNYASVGLAILILTLIIGVVERLYHDMKVRAEQEELERIAYIDQLTGIPNRISLTNKMKELLPEQWYAVAFFDVDGLKTANDNYGHDIGDELIKEAAGVIKIAFGNQRGFYGRWGGDEFVAVFLDKSSYVKFDLAFGRDLDYIAGKTQLPVPFSISVGYMEHMPGSPVNINDIINQADERMYYNKKLRKKERKD